MMEFLSDDAIYWTLAVAIGYPLIAIFLVELQRKFKEPFPDAAKICSLLQVSVLPLLSIHILTSRVAHASPDGTASKLLLSVLAITTINACLVLMNVVMRSSLLSEDGNQKAPGLMLDLLRMFLVLVAAAFVASEIWAVDLGSLLAALGVGSVVLGLALQDTLSGLFAGVSLMSGRHFKEGDWIEFGEVSGCIVHMNWRTVTIETLDDNRLVVIPNSELSKAIFTVLSTANRTYGENILVSFSYASPPARVMDALERAVFAVDLILRDPGHDIDLAKQDENGIVYEVTIHTRSRKEGEEAVTDFLRKLWYICQRESLVLTGAANRRFGAGQAPSMSPEALVQRLTATEIFPKESIGFEQVASNARYELYDDKELLLASGEPFTQLFLVVAGTLTVSVGHGEQRRVVQRVGMNEFFIGRSFLTGAPAAVSLEAQGEVAVIRLDAEPVLHFLNANPGLARSFEAAIDMTELGLATVISHKDGT